MTSNNDRPTSVLDRSTGKDLVVAGGPVRGRATGRPSARQPAPGAGRDLGDAAARVPAAGAPAGRSLARGWGSREERRLMLWGLAGFLLLGLYATAFVVIGQIVWS